MPDPSDATGDIPPRPLLSLAAELDAQAASAPARARSVPPPAPAPRRAQPGALARALAEARARAAAGAPSPARSGVAQARPADGSGACLHAAAPQPATPWHGRTVMLLASGASLGGALALFVTPALSEHRDLALGAFLCLALGLAGVAAGPAPRPSPRHMPDPAPEPPVPPLPSSEAASTPPRPALDELHASLDALRRAMAGGGGETPAEAST